MTKYQINAILRNHYTPSRYGYGYVYKNKTIQSGEITSSGLGYLYIDPLRARNIYIPNQGMRIGLL